MIDSWNAAKLNERITQVEKKIQSNDVIANPTGTATDTLEKISIDGDIYSIGSGLPEVTVSDNGDVLTVLEGVWAKGSPSPSVIDYKLTEQEVGSKWINDKPIYQKTYELTSVSSSWTALETNATVDEIISCSNLVTPDSTDNLAYTCQARVVRETGSVDYKNSASVSVPSGSKAYVTIQYTKKTEE